MRFVEMKRLRERLPEAFEKVERPAEEEHLPLDAPALREPGDRLIDDRLEDGGRDILLARALVEKRLDIRFCKHAAAGGNGIDALRLQRKLVHFGNADVEQRRHLVDEGARAACAASVHALFRPARHEDDLGILAAELYGDVRIRIKLADGAECRLHLLHEGDLSALRKPQPRRARDAHAKPRAECADLFKFAQHAFFHARVMPLV